MTTQVSVNPGVGLKTSHRGGYVQDLVNTRPSLDSTTLGAATTLVQTCRDRAEALLTDRPLPTTREEEWRFTDLTPLTQVKFVGVAVDRPVPSVSEINAFIHPETATTRLVFVNGVYAPQLSDLSGLPAGAIVGNLTTVASQYPQLSEYLGQQQGAEEIFTSLNTASLTDAAVVWLARNQAIDSPIQLLFVTTPGEAPEINQPRCLVVAEPGSSATLLEEYVTLNPGVYFTNGVTEIWLGENAQLHHTRLQQESQAAFHIGKTAVSQARDSRYTCNAVSLGAELSRHHLEVYQTGEQTETTLNGLTMISGDQTADTHSLIGYTRPHGSSQQIHKCIVDGHGHAIFNGKVFVPQAAQLTNAAQLSSNLLLSPKARVDTKPQLEITADNVKCTHGATVSQLDSDEVFYLQSRGIDAHSSRKLLTFAFAYDVLGQIPVASLRDSLSQLVRNQV